MVVREVRQMLGGMRILGSHSNRNACHEATVEIPKVMSQLVGSVYDLKEYSGREEEVKYRWEAVGYSEMSSDTLGISIDAGVWYRVFERTWFCQYAQAPRVVIAVRGTVDWVDVKSDARVLARVLDRDCRYDHLKDVADRVVRMFGHENVSMAGHSLGAAFVLLVAKALVKDQRPVETYLFNPPFPSPDFLFSRSLRRLEKSCKAMLLGMYTILSDFSSDIHDKLITIRKDFHSATKCKWTPKVFLNKGDLVGIGYIDHVTDLMAGDHAGFRKKVAKWVAPYTLLSLITGTKPPQHLLASADFIFADSCHHALESHKLELWSKDNSDWKTGILVEGLTFGRQLCQRTYNMRREYIECGLDSNITVQLMAYSQTKTAAFLQAAASTTTLGLATSKQKEVFFLFNTEADAKTAELLWPEEMRNWHINDCIAQAQCFEYRLQKFRKNATTFYVYAVRSRGVTFQREIEWRAVLRTFELMEDVTNWIKYFRHVVILAVLPVW